MVHERFGRDQHQLLIRKIFHIWQVSTVKDYVDRFAELANHLASHNSSIDALSYTIRFVGSLHDDIRVVIVVHCL